MTTPDRCFVSKSRGTVIDVIDPATGLTEIYGKSLAQIRESYPDAEETTLDDFCEWKAAQQDSPITWEPTTAERFDDMLNVLPQAIMGGGGFLVGEPYDHHAKSGKGRFQGFRQRGEVYEIASRPMTRDEFRAEMNHKGIVA